MGMSPWRKAIEPPAGVWEWFVGEVPDACVQKRLDPLKVWP